jgi:hypothetical protein
LAAVEFVAWNLPERDGAASSIDADEGKDNAAEGGRRKAEGETREC